jgi:tetratricopeptide (TPR) repeat protein
MPNFGSDQSRNIESRVVVVEALAGSARHNWLEQEMQEMAVLPGTRTFLLSGDFDKGGPWAGIREMLSSLFPEIQARCPELVEKHVLELVYVLPLLRRFLVVHNPTLTDLAPYNERSRSYAADRAYRNLHGIIDLLESWKSIVEPEVPWVIVCNDYDLAGPMVQMFFRQLMRRRGRQLRLRLLVGVSSGKGAETQASFSQTPVTETIILDLPADPPSAMNPLEAAQLAHNLEKQVDDNHLEMQVHLPDLIRCWLLAGRLDKVLHWRYFGLDTYNLLGLYEDALRYADGLLELAEQQAPDDEQLQWNIIIRLLSVYSALQNPKAGLSLAEGKVMKIVERHPVWQGQVYYMAAMFHARYSKPRDLAKGERYLDQGLAAIEQAGLPLTEYHFRSVFNRNGLAMIRNFQGRYEEAIELCRQGTERLNAHLAADQHRLHRSVLIYNIAQVYSATALLEEALQYYTVVIQLDPNYSEYYNERGNLLQQLGRLQEAHADYLKAIDLSPPYSEVFTNLGQCCRRMGALQEALEAYSRALDLEPNQALAFLGRAKVHELLGQNQEAITDYTAGLREDPSQWEGFASRGVLYYEAGNLDLALTDFNQAIFLKPQLGDLYQNRSIVLADLGRCREAVQDIESALALNPSEEDRISLQARLDSISAVASPN